MRAFFWHTLCANARHTWCVLGADRCRREDGRATHPHQEGGEVASPAGIRLLSPYTRQTCAEGNLSRALLFTKDYLTALRRLKEKQTNKRCGQVAISEGNPPGDEYQRCQGLSRVAGDTPTIWGERWCALCGDDMNAHCADLIVWFLHKDWYYSAMHCKAASPGHDKDLFISTSCYGWWRSDCARLSERTLLDSKSGLNETRTPADESTASHNCV